ncbi:HAD family hydrolase [Anaerocolumna sp. AGMB13025]|uniref:HAD family hydrolase n=1 Tax=Anaerocolumna sp. AGMB13025 TaxID=3039116 RepID=UPI00241E7863|nr:HAD family hydrolase [Anaerocolumna sp. AGMB13025]WFR57287.1 HAD family hydrolase [Anaerocolumna sp. AGMB13025]
MNTFIFDLDGTLLPMPSQELFLDSYFKALAVKLIPYGLDVEKLTKAVWTGTYAMINNDGTRTNEQRFWDTFSNILGEDMRDMEPIFDEFYKNEFNLAKTTTSSNPLAMDCVRLLKEKGYTVVLATNPIFPQVATHTRIGWAGLEVKDFAHITTYENSSYCKPNLDYYKEILSVLQKTPEECIMIGNDVKEDMCAKTLGMEAFLLMDCLINKEEADIAAYKQGDFYELLELIKGLPDLR